MTPTEVVAALEAGQPDMLLGVTESQRAEFKSAPWEIHTRDGKFEAVKDVVAMANGEGESSCLE